MAKEEGRRLFDIHHLNGLCGKKSKGYDRVSEIDGLITLCHKCHYNRPEHGQNVRPRVAKDRTYVYRVLTKTLSPALTKIVLHVE